MKNVPMWAMLLAGALSAVAATAQAADPCVSGLPPGKRPGPYSFLVATGPNRGTQHCYICETENRPAVLIFARTPSESLGKLALGIDRALLTYQKEDLRGWITFLSADQTTMDRQVVEWGKKQGLRTLPLGVFEDLDGPPSYRLKREADVTVLVFVNQKVVHNFAFREGELKEQQIKDILATLPKLVTVRKE